MSLNTAFQSAFSGLQVTARGTQVVADNIANAATEGYGPRTLTQSARVLGGQGSGVVVTGIDRRTSAPVLEDLRQARATQSSADLTTSFWRDIEAAFGQSGQPGALSTTIVAFETALMQAATSPDSRAALAMTAQAAQDIPDRFQRIHAHLATEHARADAALTRDIDGLNRAFAQIAQINSDIVRVSVTQGDTNALVDQRQLLIDQVAEYLPVKEIPREFGRSTITALDGTILVDHSPVQFGLQPSTLSGTTGPAQGAITLNGKPLQSGGPVLKDGRLSATLQLRDVHIPALQAKIDQLAADMIARFSGPAADPTLQNGQQGLFVDAGNLSAGAFPSGLSGRIQLSPRINPEDPATLWRLRDGLQAAAPGPVGDGTTLSRLLGQLRDARPLNGSPSPARSSFSHVTDVISDIATSRLASESQQARSNARSAALTEQINALGVDTDAEMQRLLLLEKHYAANAKVIAAVDTMLRSLLEI